MSCKESNEFSAVSINLYEILGSHSGDVKDYRLLECDAMSFGHWFPTFRTIVSPST
jgi:hypothetical protein